MEFSKHYSDGPSHQGSEEDPMTFLNEQRAKLAALGDMQRVAQMQTTLAQRVQHRMNHIDQLLDGSATAASSGGDDGHYERAPARDGDGVEGLGLCTTCFDSPCACPDRSAATDNSNQLCTSCFDSPCSCDPATKRRGGGGLCRTCFDVPCRCQPAPARAAEPRPQPHSQPQQRSRPPQPQQSHTQSEPHAHPITPHHHAQAAAHDSHPPAPDAYHRHTDHNPNSHHAGGQDYRFNHHAAAGEGSSTGHSAPSRTSMGGSDRQGEQYDDHCGAPPRGYGDHYAAGQYAASASHDAPNLARAAAKATATSATASATTTPSTTGATTDVATGATGTTGPGSATSAAVAAGGGSSEARAADDGGYGARQSTAREAIMELRRQLELDKQGALEDQARAFRAQMEQRDAAIGDERQRLRQRIRLVEEERDTVKAAAAAAAAVAAAATSTASSSSGPCSAAGEESGSTRDDDTEVTEFAKGVRGAGGSTERAAKEAAADMVGGGDGDGDGDGDVDGDGSEATHESKRREKPSSTDEPTDDGTVAAGDAGIDAGKASEQLEAAAAWRARTTKELSESRAATAAAEGKVAELLQAGAVQQWHFALCAARVTTAANARVDAAADRERDLVEEVEALEGRVARLSTQWARLREAATDTARYVITYFSL